MVMRGDDVVSLVEDDLWPIFNKEKERLDRIDRWSRWDADPVQLPPTATAEHRYLAELARTPWLDLVVRTTTQILHVDGYRSPENRDNAAPWAAWKANQMPRRQHPLHDATVRYGYAHTAVLPGEAAIDGGQPGARAKIRAYSPRKMLSVYADPVDDEWPVYALHVDPQPNKSYSIRLLDDQAVYFLSRDATTGKLTFLEYRRHGAGVCPVIQYSAMDLDGRADGEVDPYITTAERANKTTYDRILAQHYNSWKVRYVAGLSKPVKEGDQATAKKQLRQDDMLVFSDPDTKAGTLPETSLDGLLKSERSEVEVLAALTQTPTHNLTGQLVNLSAEALAAARAALRQKGEIWQDSLGESHAQTLRLAAYLEGDAASATDFSAQVTWQDMETRSLSQAADALGKIAQQLGVPPQALWSRIPGVTKADVDEWKVLAENPDELLELLTRPPGTELPGTPGAQPSPSPNGISSGLVG